MSTIDILYAILIIIGFGFIVHGNFHAVDSGNKEHIAEKLIGIVFIVFAVVIHITSFIIT